MCYFGFKNIDYLQKEMLLSSNWMWWQEVGEMAVVVVCFISFMKVIKKNGGTLARMSQLQWQGDTRLELQLEKLMLGMSKGLVGLHQLTWHFTNHLLCVILHTNLSLSLFTAPWKMAWKHSFLDEETETLRSSVVSVRPRWECASVVHSMTPRRLST